MFRVTLSFLLFLIVLNVLAQNKITKRDTIKHKLEDATSSLHLFDPNNKITDVRISLMPRFRFCNTPKQELSSTDSMRLLDSLLGFDINSKTTKNLKGAQYDDNGTNSFWITNHAGSRLVLHLSFKSGFYQSFRFYGTLALIIGLFLFIYIRLRLRKSNRRQQELTKLVEEKTRELQIEKEEMQKNVQIIKAHNKEKDILIQEIHHRVKNNLQYISSLVEMQLMTLETKKSREILGETYRRIRSMSIVHEQLYASDNLSQISARDYLKYLIESINEMVNLEQLPIIFRPRMCHINLSVNDCIALGMITSEAISNAIKYAFFGVENPQITIDLFHNKDHSLIHFRIADNGIGIPNKFTNKTPKTLGLRLIRIFSSQLDGECSIENKSGTHLTVIFKERKNEGDNL